MARGSDQPRTEPRPWRRSRRQPKYTLFEALEVAAARGDLEQLRTLLDVSMSCPTATPSLRAFQARFSAPTCRRPMPTPSSVPPSAFAQTELPFFLAIARARGGGPPPGSRPRIGCRSRSSQQPPRRSSICRATPWLDRVERLSPGATRSSEAESIRASGLIPWGGACQGRAMRRSSAHASLPFRHRHVPLHRRRRLDVAAGRGRSGDVRVRARAPPGDAPNAWETHDGVEIDTQGDSFFVAFARAADAVAAARAAQAALAAHALRAADWHPHRRAAADEDGLRRHGRASRGADRRRGPRRPGAALAGDARPARGRRRRRRPRRAPAQGPDAAGADLPARRRRVPAAAQPEQVDAARSRAPARRTRDRAARRRRPAARASGSSRSRAPAAPARPGSPCSSRPSSRTSSRTALISSRWRR